MNKKSKNNIWSIADCISFIICDDNTDDQVSSVSEPISSPSPDSATLSSGNESSSTDSSDWNTLIIRRLSSAKSIPIQKRKNTKHAIKPYSLSFIAKEGDLRYNLYDLFYPFTNLQSVLFSHLHPYIERDYKKIKLSVNNCNSITDEIKEKEKIKDQNMNWNDIKSVKRIRQLIEKLLLSGGTDGIKEDNIYLMFSSPKPTQIIQQLRFGVLENICKIHIDRFGRRTYHFNSKFRHQRSQLLFYNHSKNGQSMLDNIDMVGLSDFVATDNINDKNSIHYHDNGIVIDKNQGIRWQNYTIHEYLHARIHNKSFSKPNFSIV